ncbi:uncharacterized protein LOC131948999 [Physella acuta]|uniref:uncharacterized protein LOC131948999 n=1 Tax=Physella acuta TaxID=109671 RepID=UPI0027DBE9D2|nr:uncharacterized protein LOC131948999 [Physella acuta]
MPNTPAYTPASLEGASDKHGNQTFNNGIGLNNTASFRGTGKFNSCFFNGPGSNNSVIFSGAGSFNKVFVNGIVNGSTTTIEFSGDGNKIFLNSLNNGETSRISVTGNGENIFRNGTEKVSTNSNTVFIHGDRKKSFEAAHQAQTSGTKVTHMTWDEFIELTRKGAAEAKRQSRSKVVDAARFSRAVRGKSAPASGSGTTSRDAASDPCSSTAENVSSTSHGEQATSTPAKEKMSRRTPANENKSPNTPAHKNIIRITPANDARHITLTDFNLHNFNQTCLDTFGPNCSIVVEGMHIMNFRM